MNCLTLKNTGSFAGIFWLIGGESRQVTLKIINMEKIEFREKVAYRGAGGFCRATGVDCYARDTMEYTASVCAKVIAITPLGRRGPGACEIEIPVRQVGEFVQLAMKTAGIDPVEWAKQIVYDAGLLAVKRVHES